MPSSLERAVLAVERAIAQKEGPLTVSGREFNDRTTAAVARRVLAEQAATEAALLRQYIPIEPPCPWCGLAIEPWHDWQKIGGAAWHDMLGLNCAESFVDARDRNDEDGIPHDAGDEE